MRLTRSWLPATLRVVAIGAATLVALIAMPVAASADSAPTTHWTTAASAGKVSSQAPANSCTVQSVGSGVNVRPHPTDDTTQRPLGQLQLGQRVTSPGCGGPFGDFESGCGGPTTTMWWQIDFRLPSGVVTGFVVFGCLVPV